MGMSYKRQTHRQGKQFRSMKNIIKNHRMELIAAVKIKCTYYLIEYLLEN